MTTLKQHIGDLIAAIGEGATNAEVTAAILKAVGEWQPIETAPKDGTRILICRQFPEFTQVDIDLFRNGVWWKSTPYNQPIGWKPLPEPSMVTSTHRGGA